MGRRRAAAWRLPGVRLWIVRFRSGILAFHVDDSARLIAFSTLSGSADSAARWTSRLMNMRRTFEPGRGTAAFSLAAAFEHGGSWDLPVDSRQSGTVAVAEGKRPSGSGVRRLSA